TGNRHMRRQLWIFPRSPWAAAWSVALLVVWASSATPSPAVTVTWSAASPGSLTTSSNWGGSLPDNTDVIANIATNPTAAGNFTLNGSLTFGQFNYTNSQTRSITGSGQLILDVSTGLAQFDVEN